MTFASAPVAVAERANVTHHQSSFYGTGGLEFYYQCWCPDGGVKAALAIVHGFGEHSGRYMHLVEQLAPRGYAIFGFDHRGHGRSPGQRGHINAWAEYRGDVQAFLRRISEQAPGCPAVLLGHSMGALVVLDYILRRPQDLCGAIISGAPIEPAGVAGPYRILVARLLACIWPRFPMRLSLDATALSRDPAVVRAYDTDPLVHDLATARWAAESFRVLQWVRAHAAHVSLPVLFIHGGSDRLNLVCGCRCFFQQIAFPEKELKIYPEAHHEPHNDFGHEQVESDVERWLQRLIA